jgi:hypothetical protein
MTRKSQKMFRTTQETFSNTFDFHYVEKEEREAISELVKYQLEKTQVKFEISAPLMSSVSVGFYHFNIFLTNCWPNGNQTC